MERLQDGEGEEKVSTPTIRVRDQQGVRHVTLCRPERRNAITPQMQDELIAAFEEAAQARGCRALVLSGSGEVFCSGLDLDELRTSGSKSAAEHADDARRLARLFRTLYELPLPTVALVQGAAIAGGAGLATICDYTLATPGAKFGYTEVRIGFVPAMVSAYLALQIGDKRARGLLLSGRLFTAEEGHAMGLVSELVAPERLCQRGTEFAEQIAVNSPEAIAATKRLLAAEQAAWLDRATEAAMRASAEARGSADFREGVAAFLEKRKPVWGREPR